MKYAKIPLDERLGRLSGFQHTNWAYAPMLRDWAETPIASYLGEGSRYRSFLGLLGITGEGESAMTYAGAMARIGTWFDDGRLTHLTGQALRCLAEPLLEAYRERGKKQGKPLEDGAPGAAWLSMGTYFNYVTQACGQGAAAHYWELLKSAPCRGIDNDLVAQAAAKALTGKYPPEVGEELLYLILVRPYRDGAPWEGGKK